MSKIGTFNISKLGYTKSNISSGEGSGETLHTGECLRNAFVWTVIENDKLRSKGFLGGSSQDTDCSLRTCKNFHPYNQDTDMAIGGSFRVQLLPS